MDSSRRTHPFGSGTAQYASLAPGAMKKKERKSMCCMPALHSLVVAYQAGKFIVDPHSSKWLCWWDALIILLIVLVAFFIPYQIAFCLMIQDDGSPQIVTRVVDMVFIFDILMQFFISTQHPENRRWLRIPKKIVAAYLSGFFVMDVISVLPYDELALEVTRRYGSHFAFLGVLKTLSLIRLLRINRLIARYEAAVDVPYTSVKLTKLLVLLCFGLHWIACAWGFLLAFERFEDPDAADWASNVRSAKPGMFKGDKETPWELYTASMYWSCMTITSIGYGDVIAMNGLEAWGATILMALSGLLWAHIIGSICAIAGAMDEGNVAHENTLLSLNTMTRSYNVPQEIRVKLREYFMCRKALFYREKQVELVRAMSPELQGKTARYVQDSWLSQVSFFKNCCNAFVVGLFEILNFCVYPPRELVRLPFSMCFLHQGVILKQGRIMPAGCMWGVEDLILSNKDLLDDYAPLALSYLEVQYLERSALERLQDQFPQERAHMRKFTGYYALKRGVLRGIVKPSWYFFAMTPGCVEIHGPLENDDVPGYSVDQARFLALEKKVQDVLHILKPNGTIPAPGAPNQLQVLEAKVNSLLKRLPVDMPTNRQPNANP